MSRLNCDLVIDIDYCLRFVRIGGPLEEHAMEKIYRALKAVFAL
jgi:hypothetical protein